MDRPRRALRSNPLRAAKLKKPARATRSSVAYFNSQSPSSDYDDDDFDNEDSDNSSIPIPRKLTTKTATSQKRKRNTKSDHDDYSPPPKKVARHTRNSTKESTRKTIAPRTPNSTAASPVATQSTSSRPPPSKCNIPWPVLECIFEQMAAPIRDISSRREDVCEAVADLLSAALVCKDFCEAALKALYKCPPFYHQWRYTKDPYTSLSQFIDTLNLDPETTKVKYRPKVKILQIEVGSSLTQRHGANYTNLQNVIPNLEQLSHLEFYHESDEPPYRKLDEHVRFKCAADELVRALGGLKLDGERRPTRLKSWRWNSRLTSDKSLSLGDLEKLHLNPSFASLEKVAFVNYQLPSWGMPQRVQDSEQMQEKNHLKMTQLSACISALPKLEYLVFESCTLVNGQILSRLPTTLKHLELITCWEVTADDLVEFLLSHGHHMESLTVNHCQSLSLAFLPVLRSACPNLQRLYMDLSYFRHHEHYADNKPEYEDLLTEEQVPTWPSSMQSVEIFHMRKWTRKAAEMFFGSLIQSAPDLPHLRRLSLSVALDIGWRQRQDFREFWVDKMVRVFKRKAKSPRDPKTLRSAPTEPHRQGEKESELESSKSAPLPKRRSTRLANISPTPTSSEGEAIYLTKAQLAKASALSKEARRLRGSGKLLKERPLKEPDADDEDSEDELAAGNSDGSRLSRRIRRISKLSTGSDEFIHGMCNVVDIQVDNHRPMERQFDMDDFLDSPEDSDDEWDGGDADVFD
ncbi:hypothetical protein F5Y06DRAFT_280846 [Hypoxylon sp. FL0890]|nr:hypothetical protein F5Y06DRAFT_280846 [Hypoxylon sp. FL0890]